MSLQLIINFGMDAGDTNDSGAGELTIRVMRAGIDSVGFDSLSFRNRS